MRKALCAAVLLVLVWTSVAGASVPSLSQYWAGVTDTQSGTLSGYDGHDWLDWPETARIAWVSGYIAGTWRLVRYLADSLLPAPLSLVVTSDAYWAVQSAVEESIYRYRVGAYTLELDVLYREPANLSIRLIDAMYIANERLNGREVNLDQWRAKGQKL